MDRHPSRRTLTALGLIVLLLGAVPAGAQATAPHLPDLHAHEVALSAGHAALSRAGALLLLGAALLVGLRRWRRADARGRGQALAIALSFVLTVFTLETAVHSVHHLADPESGADCPVLSGSQNLSWDTGDLPGIDAPSLDASPAPPSRPAAGPRRQLDRPSPGRAPPA